MSDSAVEIITKAVQLIVAVFVLWLIPAIKKYLNNKQISDVADKAVKAAQQTLWDQDGTVRKQFAMNFAKSLLEKAHVKITDDQLSAIIEAAVKELRIAEGVKYKTTNTTSKKDATVKKEGE